MLYHLFQAGTLFEIHPQSSSILLLYLLQQPRQLDFQVQDIKHGE